MIKNQYLIESENLLQKFLKTFVTIAVIYAFCRSIALKYNHEYYLILLANKFYNLDLSYNYNDFLSNNGVNK